MAYKDYQALLCILTRSCDSHNLNVSPFCKLGKSAGPVKWADDVQSLYEDIPGYIQELRSPMRDFYKTPEMREQALLKIEVTEKHKGLILLREFRKVPNTMPLREILRLSTYSLENLQQLVFFQRNEFQMIMVILQCMKRLER